MTQLGILYARAVRNFFFFVLLGLDFQTALQTSYLTLAMHLPHSRIIFREITEQRNGV